MSRSLQGMTVERLACSVKVATPDTLLTLIQLGIRLGNAVPTN
jgi:hypothetical protein